MDPRRPQGDGYSFLPSMFYLPGQLFNPSSAASGDCLIGRSKNPMHTENLM